MTSKTSLTELIETILIAHEYNDVTGTVSVNVTEALLAIATAINRLAIAHEAGLAQSQEMVERMNGVMVLESSDDAPGHA